MSISQEILDRLEANDPSLKMLDLKNLGLTDIDIEKLCQVLAQNTRVTSVDLSDNDIGAQGAKAFAKNTTVMILNMSMNHIGDEGAEALAENTRLTSLDVSYNGISSKGLIALIALFKYRNVILKMSGNGGGYKQPLPLNAPDNRISGESAEALAQNTTVTSVDVSCTGLITWACNRYNRAVTFFGGSRCTNDEGARTIEQSATLTNLNGSSTQISDEGARPNIGALFTRFMNALSDEERHRVMPPLSAILASRETDNSSDQSNESNQLRSSRL